MPEPLPSPLAARSTETLVLLVHDAGLQDTVGAAGPVGSPTSEKFVAADVTPELLVAVTVPMVSLAPTLNVSTASLPLLPRWKPWLRSVLSLYVYEAMPLAEAVEVAVTWKLPP